MLDFLENIKAEDLQTFPYLYAILFKAAAWSFSPLGESKVGFSYALAQNSPFWLAFFVCVIANSLVVPITFYFLKYLHPRMIKYPLYKKTALYTAKRGLKLFKSRNSPYLLLSLFLYVAIPLPGTGVYSASIVAYILRANPLKSFYAITLGLVVSVFIVGIIFQMSKKGYDLFNIG